MIKNMHMRAKGDLEAGEDDDEKLDKPPQVNNLRRLSLAAFQFFSGDKKKKDEKKRKSGQYPDNNPEDDDLPDFFTAPGGRRPSLLDVLGPMSTSSSGSNTPLSPVLEQTSLADFIRIMSTLRSIEGGTGSQDSPVLPDIARTRHGSLNQIFSEALQQQSGPEPPLPRELLRTKESSGFARPRRYSQAPTRQELIGIRQRAASLSQGGGLHFDRRRMSGRFNPPARALSGNVSSPPPVLPSLVVTSPDGNHRFRVEPVNRNDAGANWKRLRGNSLSDV